MTFCKHLPQTARWGKRLAVVRSMSTREGDHVRARDELRTGYRPQGPIRFPVLGSLVSKECETRASDLPNYVSILPGGIFTPGVPPAGFLGPQHAPLLVDRSVDEAAAGAKLQVRNLAPPPGLNAAAASERAAMLARLQRTFLAEHPGVAADGYRTAYDRAERLMKPDTARAFNLDDEADDVQERYGRSTFGQGCLLARRLVERQVPFVEVTLGGWDTHDDNFTQVKNLCGTLDAAWAALMHDLDERGLLDSTLVVWMGEFGRTSAINPRNGRDHYPKAWSVVLGGGGIQGGGALGSTGADGLEVTDRPVAIADLQATIVRAVGLDPAKQNMSNVGRPIRLVDPNAKPLAEILT